MGTGTCSPDLHFPSVTVVRSPESVRIGSRRGGGPEAETALAVQCSAVQCRLEHSRFEYGRPCYLASAVLPGGQQDFEYSLVYWQIGSLRSHPDRGKSDDPAPINCGVSRPVLSRPVTAR